MPDNKDVSERTFKIVPTHFIQSKQKINPSHTVTLLNSPFKLNKPAFPLVLLFLLKFDLRVVEDDHHPTNKQKKRVCHSPFILSYELPFMQTQSLRKAVNVVLLYYTTLHYNNIQI